MEQNNTEIWKPVVGYEGRYEVSSLGRVRSLLVRYVNAANRLCVYGGNTLKGSVNRDGYLVFSVRMKPVNATVRVHVAVCTAFNGPKPSPHHEVNHKNFNRLDNRPENLEWVTHVENVKKSAGAGRMRSVNGKVAPNLRLTPDKALSIRQALETGRETRQQIADRFQCNRHTVNEIALGKQWVIGATPLYLNPVESNNPWKHPNRRKKLTPEKVQEMRLARADGVSVRDIAKAYGVAVSTANDIIRGVSWPITSTDPSVE